MLESMGGVTPENANKANPKLRNKAMTAMQQCIGQDKKAEYKDLTSDDQRREWIAEYLLDPASGGCIGKNFAQRTSTSSNTSLWVWLTLEELSGPRWLNSVKNAEIAVTSMLSRPHSTNSALANAGVMEFRHHIRKEELKKAIEEGARLEQEAPVPLTAYNKVYEHMTNSMNPGFEDPRPPKKQRAQKDKEKDKEQDTPEKIAHKAMCIQPLGVSIVGWSGNA